MKLSLDSMSPRERRMVVLGGILAAVIVVLGSVLTLNAKVASAQERLERKQADLAWMRSVAPELAAAGPVRPQNPSGESLLVQVDRAARESGLGSALTSSEPSGDRGLRVRLERAQFNLLVAWLARMSDQLGIRVESATIDQAGEPGVVNARIVLRGP
jgi:type II secretory pathway component PulM